MYCSRLNFPYVQQTTGIQNLNVNYYLTSKIALPRKHEQQAIAEYLDQACQTIDQTIEVKKKQLEKLDAYRKSVIHEAVTKGLDKDVPMKPSGVEWLGGVPEYWKLKKISYLLEVKDGTHDTPTYELSQEGSYPFVTSKDVVENRIDFSNVKYISQDDYDDYSRRSNVQVDDIIMPMIGTIGNAAIIETDRPFAIKNAALFKTSSSKLVSHEFLAYFLDSKANIDQFYLLSKGGVQSFLSLKILRNMKLLFPELKEQKAISEYLDQACNTIDQAKQMIEKQVDKLTQYRKSLIHECVTGKKRIYQGEV